MSRAFASGAGSFADRLMMVGGCGDVCLRSDVEVAACTAMECSGRSRKTREHIRVYEHPSHRHTMMRLDYALEFISLVDVIVCGFRYMIGRE
jgi:hypothetical protein